jgi:perosamine synthetase
MVGGVPLHDSRTAREIDGVTPLSDPDNGRHVYWLYTATLDDDVDRESVIETIADNGVSSKVYFDPVHRLHYYVEEYRQDIANLAVTDQVFFRVLSLPMHPHLEAEAIERIAESLIEAPR